MRYPDRAVQGSLLLCLPGRDLLLEDDRRFPNLYLRRFSLLLQLEKSILEVLLSEEQAPGLGMLSLPRKIKVLQGRRQFIADLHLGKDDQKETLRLKHPGDLLHKVGRSNPDLRRAPAFGRVCKQSEVASHSRSRFQMVLPGSAAQLVLNTVPARLSVPQRRSGRGRYSQRLRGEERLLPSSHSLCYTPSDSADRVRRCFSVKFNLPISRSMENELIVRSLARLI